MGDCCSLQYGRNGTSSPRKKGTVSFNIPTHTTCAVIISQACLQLMSMQAWSRKNDTGPHRRNISGARFIRMHPGMQQTFCLRECLNMLTEVHYTCHPTFKAIKSPDVYIHNLRIPTLWISGYTHPPSSDSRLPASPGDPHGGMWRTIAEGKCPCCRNNLSVPQRLYQPRPYDIRPARLQMPEPGM